MRWKAIELPLSSRDMPGITMGINLHNIRLPAPCEGNKYLFLGGVPKLRLMLEKKQGQEWQSRRDSFQYFWTHRQKSLLPCLTDGHSHPNIFACYRLIKGTEEQGPLPALFILLSFPWSHPVLIQLLATQLKIAVLLLNERHSIPSSLWFSAYAYKGIAWDPLHYFQR